MWVFVCLQRSPFVRRVHVDAAACHLQSSSAACVRYDSMCVLSLLCRFVCVTLCFLPAMGRASAARPYVPVVHAEHVHHPDRAHLLLPSHACISTCAPQSGMGHSVQHHNSTHVCFCIIKRIRCYVQVVFRAGGSTMIAQKSASQPEPSSLYGIGS